MTIETDEIRLRASTVVGFIAAEAAIYYEDEPDVDALLEVLRVGWRLALRVALHEPTAWAALVEHARADPELAEAPSMAAWIAGRNDGSDTAKELAALHAEVLLYGGE